MKLNKRLASPLRLARLFSICAVVAAAACGGGDGEEAPSNGSGGAGGGNPGGPDVNQIPASARSDGKSLVAWMSSWAMSVQDDREPLSISTEPIPKDETAEPETL